MCGCFGRFLPGVGTDENASWFSSGHLHTQQAEEYQIWTGDLNQLTDGNLGVWD